jgi:nitrous oxide reductase accessory protein NosL
MTKIGKTFTIDYDIFNWLVEHARQKERKVSYIVNMALRQIKQTTEQWKCPICNTWNDIESKGCYVLTDGEFCEGKAPKT